MCEFSNSDSDVFEIPLDWRDNMGKLNIAHHKSYHPYRRDNIDRVRRDEEGARRKEAMEEGKMMTADSEARMEQLRRRAMSAKSDQQGEDAGAGHEPISSPAQGHINLFEDLEQDAALTAKKLKRREPETEAGIPLAPRPEDLRPWYSRKQEQAEGGNDESKQNLNQKKRDDPLTSISRGLASQASINAIHGRPPPRPKYSTYSAHLSDINNRLRRESSERQRALELVRRKQREANGLDSPSMTPNRRDDYDDLFNPQEIMHVKEARRLHFQRRGHDRKDAS